MVHKIIPYVNYNQWLKHLDTQRNEQTNQNLTEVPKVVEPNKNTVLKDFGDQCNEQLNIPSLPDKSTLYLFSQENHGKHENLPRHGYK